MDYEMKTYNLMIQYLYKQCGNSGWLSHWESPHPEAVGVMMKLASKQYAKEPANLDSMMVKAVQCLNAAIAFTMVSDITAALFQELAPHETELFIQSKNLRIPIFDSLENVIYTATTKGLAGNFCVLRKSKIVLVWSDSIEAVMPLGVELEKLLCEAITGQNPDLQVNRHSALFHQMSSLTLATAPPSINEKPQRPPPPPSNNNSNWASKTTTEGSPPEYTSFFDDESGASKAAHRPMLLTHSLMVSMGLMLLVIVQMGGLSKLIGEIGIDGHYSRLCYLLMIPLSSTFALFFFTTMVACFFQFLGPVKNVNENTRYHSAIAPNPSNHPGFEYPHITIQIPVYKEGLTGVIVPTVTSCMAAIKHYESVGGTASIYINDDGMQAVSADLAEARQQYYRLKNVGWCARPPHGKDGFQRKGKFKKASNMNYCLDFSIRVEDELLRLIAEFEKEYPGEQIDVERENELYEIAMETILGDDDGKTWAAGNVRLGELILLLDSDTKVPIDCLQLGALEMHESPNVAIIQHASGVMQVAHNMFENAITYLTDLIYTSISYAVGSGDLACFVGHNAFLRWRAIQSVAFEEDGKVKYWSDSHVSEDFDQALRLQIAGFIMRLASYHNGGFEEGVSLTVFDELARWEKYTYGCNELLFHPFQKWLTHGPLTPLLWKLINSNVKSTSKVTILGYVFTYYAMAAALPFTVLNYFLIGLMGDQVDHYYLSSFKIMLSLLLVFNVISPIAYNFLLHRLGKVEFKDGMLKSLKWMPFFMIFFGGLSIHLSKAIICHFCSINMEWASTGKELEATGFFIGMDKIIKDFKYMYLIVFILTGVMIYLAVYAPWNWKITDFSMILPVANQLICHFLLPVVLGLF